MGRRSDGGIDVEAFWGFGGGELIGWLWSRDVRAEGKKRCEC